MEAVQYQRGGRDDATEDTVQLGLGLWRRGVSSSAVAPATGALPPQPDASSPDFPGHSAVWDAQTELRDTDIDTDTESTRTARVSFAEMLAGNLSYAKVRAIAKQETAAAALSPKQGRKKSGNEARKDPVSLNEDGG
ncbi:hypothetical protein FIBSPDRAFT_863703 [Athelia psychrophila]|uniref:Uncharacterized protein n=1 Tax=Athelia psychrophila TaxID=1759441 RepID=A0A166H3V9_9AGAM|nr:hypothetical protein FIBSPDRAFT_863703 [Fibularhizoctonia sp. CBS 109695]